MSWGTERMSLTEEERHLLLAIARQSIEHGLKTGKPLSVDLGACSPNLVAPCATFATLNTRGNLRGCIGMLQAIKPMAQDIADNAFSAAFKDSRFPPLQAHELPQLEIHLSLLSAAEPIHFESENDLLGQLKPGIDGLILKEGSRRATFLPSVWQTLPKREDFLRHLKAKAGLPDDYWSPTIKFERYHTDTIE